MLDGFVDFALGIAQPETGGLGDVQFAIGVFGQAVTAGLVVRTLAFDRAIVLRDMEIERPWTQDVGHFFVRGVENFFIFPVIVGWQQRVFWGVVAHQE